DYAHDGEIYDCGQAEDPGADSDGDNAPFATGPYSNGLDATNHNLVQNNDFAFSVINANGAPGDFASEDGIQYGAQDGIIRQNRFYNIGGVGLDMVAAATDFDPEESYVIGNRVYNN